MNDYEVALIACLLNKPEYKTYVSDLSGDYFEYEDMAQVFEAIEPKDTFPQIVRKLEGKVSFKDLIKIQDLLKVISVNDVIMYGSLVLYGYKERQVKKLGELTLEQADSEIKRLKNLDINTPVTAKVSDSFLDDLDKIVRGEPDTSTIPTGFAQIDNVLRGFRKSELVIIGGRPAMGKSTLGLNMACNMAKSGKKVVFFSLEMAKKELHQRMVKAETGIENIFKINQEQFEACASVSRYIEDSLPLTIIDTPDITVEGIHATAKRIQEQNGIDCLYIDHLSILKSKKQYKSRYEEITDISRQLKVIAKDLDIPVVALCQLNRGVESREVKIPTMMDLRDSGSIEQDADLILFIHRAEYYAIQKNEMPEPQDVGKAIISICKNRRGGVGCTEINFNVKIPMFY